MKKDLRRFPLLVGAVWLLDGSWQIWQSTLPVEWEVYEIVPMLNSDWVIEGRGDFAYLTGGSGVDIRARNTTTQQTVTIAEGDTCCPGLSLRILVDLHASSAFIDALLQMRFDNRNSVMRKIHPEARETKIQHVGLKAHL